VEEVIADGDVITILVKGTEVAKFRVLRRELRSGAIGLQCRADSKVAFRKVEIRELAPAVGAAATSARFDPRRTARVGSAGHWQIEGDELLHATSDRDAWIMFGDSNWTDYTFAADIKLIQSKAHVGLYVRNNGELKGDNYFCTAGPYATTDGGSICRVVKGKFEVLTVERDREAVLTPGTWHELKIEARGKKLTTYVDGRRTFTTTDSAHASGRVGLRAWESVCRFRNLKVTTPNGKTLWQGLPDLLTSESIGVVLGRAKGGASGVAAKAAPRADSKKAQAAKKLLEAQTFMGRQLAPLVAPKRGGASRPHGPAVRLKEIAVLKIPGSSINGLALTEDGSRLGVAAIAAPTARGWPVGHVSVWDVAEQRQLWFAKNPSVSRVYMPIHRVWITPDGKTIVTGESRWGIDHVVDQQAVVTFKVWNGATGRRERALQECIGYEVLATMSADGRSFAISPGLAREQSRLPNGRMRGDIIVGRIMVWDLGSLKLKCTFPGTTWINPGKLPEDKERGEPVKLPDEQQPVKALALSPDGSQLAIARYGGVLKLWNLETVTETRSLKGMESTDTFSNSWQWLTGGRNLVLRFGVDPKSWENRRSQRWQPLPLDKNRHATAFEVWDTNQSARKQDFILPAGGPAESDTRYSVLSADGRRLFVHVVSINPQAKPPTMANRIVVWDVMARQQLTTLRLPTENLLNREGHVENTGGGDSDEALNDVGRDMRLALSRDGKVLAVGDRQGAIRVYNVAEIEPGEH
jgi:WD40 repeat protein